MVDVPDRKRRDAAQTRQNLLDVARNRFARHGYAATTVREIADEAGVNVALISRYFKSKEGLFRACLTHAASDVREEPTAATPAQIAARLAQRLSGPPGDRRQLDAFLLLIRSSGDERIDDLRRSILLGLSEKLGGDLLRAQLVLAAAVGISLLRAALDLEPLASATEDDLRKPLEDVIHALMG
jgi:AcrR family transcriptional regulator